MRSLSSVSRHAALILAATMLTANVAQAADPCLKPTEKTAFNIVALRSQLMVTAVTCQAHELYNSFVARFRPDLMGSEKGINGYFSRTAGGRAQQAHDDYITSLANTQSEDGLQRGTDFCGKRVPMLTEVLALSDSKSLSDYANGAEVMNAIAVTECPPPADKKAKTSVKTASTTTAKPATTQ